MANIDARFWSKVAVGDPGDCWGWEAYRDRDGYGRFAIYSHPYRAHRVAWELMNGPIPEGICVCHHCDNPPCCNPAHLYLGTRADNNADMTRKGRVHGAPKGELHHNAKLTEADVIEIRVRYRAGGITQTELGREFGVAQGAFNRIVHDGTWKHLLEE